MRNYTVLECNERRACTLRVVTNDPLDEQPHSGLALEPSKTFLVLID